MNKTFFKSLISIGLIASCSKPVNIEGDVFLVKGDGTPQPSAATEVIFVPAESFESILIDSYVSTVTDEMLKYEQAFKQLCSVSTTITQGKISVLEEKFNAAQNSGIENQIIDQDGTCSNFQENFLKSEEAAAGYKLRVKELIENEESKIKAAKSEISKLQSKLKEKIYVRTKELYEDFSKDIIITMNGAIMKVTNNSEFNITLNQDMCLQYKNVLGQDVGHSDGADFGSLASCRRGGGAKDYPQYQGSGTIIKKSRIEGAGRNDQYGFNFGKYLESGATRIISGSTRYDYSRGEADFYFCERGSFSPSEKLKMSKQFGDDQKNWPKNLHLPDPSKGYKVKRVNIASARDYHGDGDACGIGAGSGNKVKFAESRFVPLEPEKRAEVDGNVTYRSKEIDFEKIATKEEYPERDNIKLQESIIDAANIEISKIKKEAESSDLLKMLAKDSAKLKECKVYIGEQELIDTELTNLRESLDMTDLCNINNVNLMSSLNLEDPNDQSLLEELREIDHTKKAKLEVLRKFESATFKTATNISGHYSLNEVPIGSYVVYSSYSDNFNQGIFLNNVELKDSGNVDLSNRNFYAVGSLANVMDLFYENCGELICSAEDLKGTLDLQKAADSWKDLQKAAKELEDSIKELERLLKG